MRVAVCIKRIADPEVPVSMFSIDQADNRAVFRDGTRWLVSPFDEQAIEAALRIRDDLGEVEIVAVTLGAEDSLAALKAALALGADRGVLLCDPLFEGGDSFTTALPLARAIERLGDIDLVLTGRQAADTDCGAVGIGIAELLAIPAVSFARRIGIEDGRAVVDRVLDDGFETVGVEPPVLVTVAHELGPPRAASLRETMRASRKPITVWTAADLGLKPAQVGAAGARRTVERLYRPEAEARCEFVRAESTGRIAIDLAQRLRQDGLLP